MCREWNKFCDEIVSTVTRRTILCKDKLKRLETLLKEKLVNPNATHHINNAHYSLLFYASVNNCEPLFKILIDHGADPTWTNDSGNTVLLPMIKREQVSMLNYSVRNMTEVCRKNFFNGSRANGNGWSPLMSAANCGRVEMVKAFVRGGADVNAEMSTGWTALHAAAKGNYSLVVKYLLDEGQADPSMTATHRDFGKNLTYLDVTTDQQILNLEVIIKNGKVTTFDDVDEIDGLMEKTKLK